MNVIITLQTSKAPPMLSMGFDRHLPGRVTRHYVLLASFPGSPTSTFYIWSTLQMKESTQRANDICQRVGKPNESELNKLYPACSLTKSSVVMTLRNLLEVGVGICYR